MYRVELQFDDVSTTQLDPRKIPHYPINDALQSVGGRNLVGLPWNALAEKQAQGAQAMLRDKAFQSALRTEFPRFIWARRVPI